MKILKRLCPLCAAVFATAALFGCGGDADSGEDISAVRFYCASDTEEIVGLEGDTDIMSPACIFPTKCSGEDLCREVSFKVKDGMQLALTSGWYRNVSTVHESSDARDKKGLIEKKRDGEWEFYSDVVYGGSTTAVPQKIPFRVESGEYSLPVCIPWYDPGEYRITYFFREFTENEDGRFSTGEQLFQVSHTVEIPEPDGNDIDIIAASVGTLGTDHSVVLGVTTQLDEMPWLYCGEADLCEWDGNGWTQNSAVSAHFAFPREYIRQNYIYPMLGVEEPEKYATVPYVICDGVDREGSYRLTLRFSENEDGSGEQYTLTLYVRFDE